MYGFGLALMSFPMPEYPTRKLRANRSAAGDRSLSQISMPSSLIENATRGVGLAGCAAFHAASSASMIGPSGIRVRADGVFGDWPCLAERMIVVDPSRCAAASAAVIDPTCVLT